jgi:hypothetical protein
VKSYWRRGGCLTGASQSVRRVAADLTSHSLRSEQQLKQVDATARNGQKNPSFQNKSFLAATPAAFPQPGAKRGAYVAEKFSAFFCLLRNGLARRWESKSPLPTLR